VQNGRDPITQRRLQLSGSAATKADALKLQREFMRRAVEGSTPDPTIRQLVEEFWASDPRLAATTRANYRANLDRHVVPILGDRRCSEIRPRLVAAFLRHLAIDGSLGAGTIRKIRTVLSSVMSFARDRLDRHPRR
jgi:hypothetical protein